MFNVIVFYVLVKVFLLFDMVVCKSDVMMFVDKGWDCIWLFLK